MASGINDTFRQVGVAVGIAAWGAIFLGRGASEVEHVAAGSPAAVGSAPRQLVEAASPGNLDGVPASSAAAAREGLAGMNDILLIGGLLALAGSAIALLLVREREIEREPLAAPEPVPEPAPA